MQFAQFDKDMSLLKKAAREKKSQEFSEKELKRLSTLLDLDKLFSNFSEKELRNYRDELSGQTIYGREIVKNSEGEMMYVSYIPTSDASRSQLYEGMIFSLVNPAVRNLAKILFELQPSDYARMPYCVAAAWAALSSVLTSVKAWAGYIDVVVSPGVMISPMMGCHDTTNLLVLDALIFGNPVDKFFEMCQSYSEFEFA